ncbi:Rho GTPase activation protein [Hymenopellis radicata]|nr:Rho GTPase activation protein [Hymenopellis radicata]
MPDDGYSSAWDGADHSDFQSTAATSTYTRPPMRSLDLQDAASSSHAHSPPPRSSSDLNDAPLSSKWRDTSTVISESHDSVSETVNLIEPAFDENVLRILCDMDCGVPLLLDRIKQSMVSCREASVFLKKRAVIEEEYGKSLQKLSRSTSELYSLNDGKAGTFVTAWQSSMRIHELMSENRLRFAQRLNEMSDELVTLSKEVDKNRKQTKDLATRYERALIESQGITEKSKNRLDLTSEELERVLLQKEGESLKDNSVQIRQGGVGGKRVIGKAVAKGGLLLKGKNPGNIQRQEDDIRTRMSTASDAFRKAVTDTQAMRQEYYNFQLPRILRALKECADEIDLGTQYHLTRYAFLFESIVLSDGSTLVPPREEGNTLSRGLKASIESIDNRGDFRTATPKGPRRDGPTDEGFLPPLPSYNRERHTPDPPSSTSNHVINLNGTSSPDKGRPTFGVDLNEQMTRDDVDVPLILKKCCEAIERHGIESHGLYRVSGTTSKVATLKQKLDKDLDSVDLDSNEWTSDINNVTSVIKMWLRELPNPLITAPLQAGFMDAAQIDIERLRHIRLHERVNDLPDPNYATLKYLLGHLHKCNISIVFGPTLFGQVMQVPNSPYGGPGEISNIQNTAIHTILVHYTDIFVDESE